MDDDDLIHSIEKLKGQDDISEADVSSATQVIKGELNPTIDPKLVKDGEEAQRKPGGAGGVLFTEEDPDSVDIRTLISKMTLPERVKTALFGNRVCRALLIRDPNKIIQQCVLKNPKLSLPEIEDFSKNPNSTEFIIRYIANNQQWTKLYSVKQNIVCNPKTPGDVSLKWIRFLNINDLKKLAKSKNVPQVVSVAAKKKVADAAANR